MDDWPTMKSMAYFILQTLGKALSRLLRTERWTRVRSFSPYSSHVHALRLVANRACSLASYHAPARSTGSLVTRTIDFNNSHSTNIGVGKTMFWRTSNYIGLKGVNESESSYANVAFFQLDEEFQNGSLAFDEVQQILYFNIGPKLLYLDFTHFIQPYLYHMRAVSYHALPEDIVDLAIDPAVQLLVVITESRICQLSVALNATNCQVASLGEKLMAVETVPENEYYLFVKVNLQGGSYNLSVVSTAYNNSWTTTTPIRCSNEWQQQSFAGVILGNGGSRGKQAALVFLIL